jgi:deoxyribose-phosphate aldolase
VDVANDIRAVRKATEGKLLKVIIETCLLTDEEKVHMCKIVADCGADYIKTSTGFSKWGATREDVQLMRENSPATVKVKAAGGISSIQDAEDFINLGADRLGTSRIVKLAMELENAEGAPQENY